MALPAAIRPYAGWALFALVMLALPFFVSNGTLRIIIFAQFLAIFAMSWDFLSGRTGYVSFGHPFLIGIGAYTSAILSHRFGMPLGASIPLAVLATMLGGTLFFLPALRIRGTYFALVTLAFMELIYQLIQVVRPDLTGGTRGMSGIPTLLIGAQNNYYLSFALMFTIALILWSLTRTRLGLALSAVGMDEHAVRGSGLDTTKLKLFAFMTSAMVAGIGGAFYVHYLGSIAPRALFDVNFLFTIIVAVLIGGASTIIGPIIGAFFLTFLLEYLRPFIPGTERYFIYGLIALVLYVYQPKGIIEILRAAASWIRLQLQGGALSELPGSTAAGITVATGLQSLAPGPELNATNSVTLAAGPPATWAAAQASRQAMASPPRPRSQPEATTPPPARLKDRQTSKQVHRQTGGQPGARDLRARVFGTRGKSGLHHETGVIGSGVLGGGNDESS